MIDDRFVLIGAALQLIGSSSYFIDTIKGKAKPNRVSWFLWAVVPLVAFSAELNHGVGLPALMTFMIGFGPLMVFLGSFLNRKSSWRITRLDVICGALSVIGIILWQATGSGNLAILFSILADGLAWFPTLVKSYYQPETENWHFFLFDAVSAAITMLAIDTWDFAYYGFPVYLFVTCVPLVALIKFKLGPRRKITFNSFASNDNDRPI